MKAITVENLGKAYLVGHNAARSERYTALRDLIARNVRDIARKSRDLIRGRPIIQGDEVEEFWALKDVSFEVEQGETLGIIGRNGAGKSTLLKVLSRITEPTTGRITLHGRVASLLEVGTGFHPELTGRENIFLNGAILGMTRREIQRKFDEIIDFAEIEQFIDTPVKRYSSGMYVRLAFAVAAHLEPEILIIDEVLAVGDAQFQKKCLGKMDDVSKQGGKTVLFVSHNMSVIQELCPRCILLKEGGINSDGATASIIKNYIGIVKANSEVDLTQLKQYGPKTYCQLLKLTLMNADLEYTTHYKMGEPLIAHLYFEITRPVKAVEIGLKVSTRFGTPIHYFTSTWENFYPDLDPGYHCVEVRVPEISMLPGSYILGAWILKGSEGSDVNVQDITSITISKGLMPTNPTRIDEYAFSGGEVYARSSWRALPSDCYQPDDIK